MIKDTQYRNLAQRVRRTARAQLQEIRQARLALQAESADTLRADDEARVSAAIDAGRIELWDRADAGLTPPSGLAAPPRGGDNVPVQDAAVPAPDHFGPPWPMEFRPGDDVVSRSTTLNTPPEDLPQPEPFGPFLPTQPADPVALGLMPALSLSPAMRVAADSAPVSLPHRDPVPETGGSSDLASLPGAGPGLIWMLQKCGIFSLHDLAAADTAHLVPKLGLVGQIVNVPGWQRYARQQVARSA